MSDFVTVLTHYTESIPLTKTYSFGDKGKTKDKEDKRLHAHHFKVDKYDIEGLGDLHELINFLQGEHYSCVIRGELIPGRDPTKVVRTKRPAKGEPAGFRDAPHSWVLIDVDWDDEKADWSNPAAVANYAVGKLPFELRTAGYVWQCSASAGIKPGIRMHLWFWLDRALSSRELKLWAEAANEVKGDHPVDTHLMDEVQQHFTAGPILQGVVDPITTARIGKVDGPPAVLPRLTEKRDTYRRHLDLLRDSGVDKIHDHVRNACASFFCGRGPDADSAEFYAEMRAAVDTAEETMGRVGDYPEGKLQDEIASGREFARNKAVMSENLLRDSSGMIKPVDSNARALLMSSPEWEGVLVKNRRTGKAEYRLPPPLDGCEVGVVQEEDAAKLGDWFHRVHGVGFKDGVCWDTIQNVAARASYDPVEEFLVGIRWDGIPRLSNWLYEAAGGRNQAVRALGVDVEREYVSRVGRMVLISAVARALTPGEVQVDTVMVLEGNQGDGKTTLIKTLAGLDFYSAHNDASSNERDALAKFYGKAWIIELKELVSLGKGVEKVKAMLDAASDEFRRAYRRDEATYVRRCIAIATTNEAAYLRDSTGGRRFWPVQTVGEIDNATLAANRDQLWAEAVVAWRSGEVWYTKADDVMFVAAQEGAFEVDEWENRILQALEDGATGFSGGHPIVILPGATELRMSDIMLCVLKDERQSRQDQRRVMAILRRLGFTNVHTRQGNKWIRQGKEPKVMEKRVVKSFSGKPLGKGSPN